MRFCAPDESGGIGSTSDKLNLQMGPTEHCVVKYRLNGEFNRNLLGNQKDDQNLICLIY